MSIEIKNLTYVYNEKSAFERKAIKDIDFTIENGEFIGLIGHTGSGKSTLIQHFNSLLKPTSGQILIDGFDINSDKSKLKSVRQKVGLVFQYPEHQLFETTIYKDVAFGAQNLGLEKEEVHCRVCDALEIVGIDESLYHKSPFDLSGGQKRRIAIAGVLAMKPQILILDEPTAGLDPFGRDEILNRIKEMHKALKITVILVSHSMEDISRLVERILVLHKGELIYNDIPKKVFAHSKELEQIGLAAPQISYLMSAIKEKGIDVPLDIFTVSDAADTLYDILKK